MTTLILSCENHKAQLNSALSAAGDNAVELRKVLKKYQHDSLKLKAAEFLIANMPYHYYYSGKRLDDQMAQYEMLSITKLTPAEIRDSLFWKYGPFNINSFNQEFDIFKIDSSYLVNNIEAAFRVRNNHPWSRNVAFSDFCEYVLPYRIGDETLPVWRDSVYNRYVHFLDDIIGVPEAEDPLFVASVLLDSLSRAPIFFTNDLPYTPRIGPKVLDWRSGTCRELADIATYVLRAFGIPCGTDYMAMRGDNNGRHFWSFVLDKNGMTYYMDFPDTAFRQAVDLLDPKAKVYRSTYSLNTEMKDAMRKNTSKIYAPFNTPKFVDVTSVYAGQYALSLKVPLERVYDSNMHETLFYLCLSVRDAWIPAAWGVKQGGTIHFENVEGGVVLRLATYDGKKLVMASDPFFFDKEKGNIRYFDCSNEHEMATLLFKYHLYSEPFIDRMPGGVFEVSNDPKFKGVDTLYMISQAPTRLYNVVYSKKNDKKYRYIRYKGAEGSFCNIAELMFFEKQSDSIPIKGTPIGTSGCFDQDGSHEYTNVFDGDPYTSFDYLDSSNGWVGLDMHNLRAVEKIIYVPRNRDNFIRKDDLYELFYWSDRKWTSLGKQKASSDSLLYTVPKGCLLYLKNHTRGKDERIFEYLDNFQKFW